MGHFTDTEAHVLVNFADLKDEEQICPFPDEPWYIEEPPKDMVGVSGLLGKFKIENNTLFIGERVYHRVVGKEGLGQWSPDANFIVDLPPKEEINRVFSKAREYFEKMAKIENLYEYNPEEIRELLNCGDEEHDDFYLQHFYDIIAYGDLAGTRFHSVLGELNVEMLPDPEGVDRGGYCPTITIGRYNYYVYIETPFHYYPTGNTYGDYGDVGEVDRNKLINKLAEEVNNKLKNL